EVGSRITRERGKVAEAFKTFDQQQANERQELERKIEQAREAGAWPEAQRRQGRAQEPQQQRPEPVQQKQQSQGPPQGRSRSGGMER
ncbi:MAG: hypothetical protein KDJ28_19310, partial [Candidatus Competibacteraceae bacterium]|nr:hypothetical protein [Candidatus Competibacteraceae bacterium]